MRIRSIKPEWLEDERLGKLDDTTRMVSVALIVMADDYGIGRGADAYLAAHIWPYRGGGSQENLRKLAGALLELEEIGFVVRYQVNGEQYFCLRNWTKHQKVSHKGKPRFPWPPHEIFEHPSDPNKSATLWRSGGSQETLPGVSALKGKGKGIREREREREGYSGITPESLSDEGVLRDCAEEALKAKPHPDLFAAVGEPPSWAPVRAVVEHFNQVWNDHEVITRRGDSRLKQILKLFANGKRPDELMQAIDGSRRSEWIRDKPNLQTLAHICKDDGTVSQYAKLAREDTERPVPRVQPDAATGYYPKASFKPAKPVDIPDPDIDPFADLVADEDKPASSGSEETST